MPRGLELRPQRPRVVDDPLRSELAHPGRRLRPRRRRNDAQPGDARQLNADRSHAARSANDEERRAALRAAGVDLHAVEERFPGGNGGERNRGRLREVHAARLRADDALVDLLQLAVASRAGHVAGVVHLVARSEQRDLWAGGGDDTGRVPAEDARRGRARAARDALLGVDRVHRHRAHAHQQIVALRRAGIGKGDVDERLGIVYR
jgi:hypothetical protein